MMKYKLVNIENIGFSMLIGCFVMILLSRRLPRPFGPRNDSGFRSSGTTAININLYSLIVFEFACRHNILWCTKKSCPFLMFFSLKLPLYRGESCDIMTVTDEFRRGNL